MKGSTTGQDTKNRILGIARDLFARKGFTGTSIADIARELGTTTAALYYHFSSKADILGGKDDHAARDKERILAGFDHSRHPVKGGIGIAATHALDERGDDVVVLLARTVVE